jgi:hypothetical protein
LLRDIVNDHRPAPVAAPPSNVTVYGAGKVQTFDYGPKYRPYVPPTEDASAPAERPGWQEPTPLRQPDGLREIDAMVMAQDLRDLEAHGREQAAAMGITLRDWVKLQLQERQEKKLRDKGPKA